MPKQNTPLGAFLRSRRDRLTPAQAGIDPFPGPRRVPGLRKEELAVLAGLSADHYSRIEQGRQQALSIEVLEALARALRLDVTERQHLLDLATVPLRRTAPSWKAEQKPDPGLLRVMSALEQLPVLLIGRRGEVLATNRLLSAVLGSQFEPGSSFLRWLFVTPAARDRIINWAEFAAAAVGGMRLELGRHPHDQLLGALVADLRANDQDVARWWDDQDVADRSSLTKEIAHPDFGRLCFSVEALTTPHEPEQRLVIYTAELGSVTAQTLPLIATWQASQQAHLTAER